MLTIKSSRLTAIRAFMLVAVTLLGMCGGAMAQWDGGGFGGGGGNRRNEGPTPNEVLTQAMQYMSDGDYDSAISSFFSYLSMVENGNQQGVRRVTQDTRYTLITLLINQDRKGEAIDVLKKYIATRPAIHIRKARKLLVACLFDESKYEECIPAIEKALYYNEHPEEDLKDDASGGFGGGMNNSFDNVKATEEEDLPYSAEELEMFQFTLGECHYNMNNLNECLGPFTYVIENTRNEQRKGYTIMQMIKTLLALEDYKRITEWVPELYKTNARYDIRVNLVLLDTAVALFEAGEYDSALPLYRMILPREEVIEYQKKKLRAMREAEGLPPAYGESWNEGEKLLFGEPEPEEEDIEEEGVSGSLFRIEEDVEEVQEIVVPAEIMELQQLIDSLEDMPPYETYVRFQTSQLYKNVSRFWESVYSFDNVYAKDPADDIGMRSVYESTQILTADLDDYAEAEKRAYPFLEEHHTGVFPRLVSYVLIANAQKRKDWKSIIRLRPYIEAIEASDDPNEQRYDAELYFMQAVADLMTQQYSNAVDRFEYVIETFPGTAQEPNSLFWCGFSYMCLDLHTNAYECFERYTRVFADLPPTDSMLDEAYYQGGVCLFGMDQLSNAVDRFTYVINQYGTNSSVYSDSLNMRGDIYGSWGGDTNQFGVDYLDLAVSDYGTAFTNAARVTQATYAVFKACDIFKADEEHYGLSHITRAVNNYLAKWGNDEEADIAKALFWLGRVDIQRNHYEAAADSYLQAILDFGGNLKQDGVDLMLPELVKICTTYLTEDQRNTIKQRIGISMESSTSEVLKLRLRILLAEFDGSQIELGKQLINELPSLDNASPPVLATICDASFESKDYSRAAELLLIFKNNFEDSDYMRSAFRLRVFGQVDAGDLEGALETIAAAQAEYGTESNVSWAQLMKADVLRTQGLLHKNGPPIEQDRMEEAAARQLLLEEGRRTGIQVELVTVQNEPVDEEGTPEEVKERRVQKEADIKRLQGNLGQLEEKIAELLLIKQGVTQGDEARAFLARCKLNDAREANMDVMGVPEWRGKPYAQATYQLGQVAEAEGNLLESHQFFQRVYYLHKGQGDWGAKAYLSAAEVLKKLSEDPSTSASDSNMYIDAREKTLKAMLLDKYANSGPEAETARALLGETTVSEVESIISSGIETNIVINVESQPDKQSSEASSGTVSESGGDA